ncbi:MAG: DUF4342 domain-containing protein [Clostridia bacterium]|nr:DUF4342 domain-containing protein [Clostridia bacterium]
MSETNQNNQGQAQHSSSVFSFLYRTRVKVLKGSTTIMNLSLLFALVSLLFAPWLVIIGFVVALVLGYRFSITRNDPGFAESIQNVVQQAAGNVKSAVDSFSPKNDQDAGEQ